MKLLEFLQQRLAMYKELDAKDIQKLNTEEDLMNYAISRLNEEQLDAFQFELSDFLRNPENFETEEHTAVNFVKTDSLEDVISPAARRVAEAFD